MNMQADRHKQLLVQVEACVKRIAYLQRLIAEENQNLIALQEKYKDITEKEPGE